MPTAEELKAIADKAAADKAAADAAAGTPTPVVKKEGAEGEPKHEATVPYERFDEINKELKARKIADDARDAKEAAAATEALKKKGEWETIANQKDKELAAAKEALKTSALKQVALVAAIAGNAVDPDAVWALLDKSTLNVADDGTVTGVQEAVTKLLASKPYLVKQANAGYPMGAGGTGGSLTTEEIGKLTPAQYREWRTKHPDA